VNGTYVNGERISAPRLLRHGDVLRLGDVSLAFSDPQAGPSPMTVRDIHADVSRQPMHTLLATLGVQRHPAIAATTAAPAMSASDRDRRRLQILLKVSQLLAAPEQIDALLGKILDLAVEILEIDRAAILLVDPATGKLEPKVVKSSIGLPREGERIYSQSIVDFVRSRSIAAVFADAMVDPRLGNAQSVFLQKILASMCAPLKPKEEVIGVLYVDKLSGSSRFSEEDLDFLAAFANQAAIAIENSTLYQRLEQEAVQRSNFLRFFPPKTIQKVLASAAGLEVAEMEVTALFSDISNFTSMSSTMRPIEVVALLNEYFPVMAEIVFRHEGTLEKYIGDALMAVWGAPFGHPDDADRALRAAIEMHHALTVLNASWAADGKPTIEIHVGLHTGIVAAGNIGSDQYLQYATIGDATNVASRVCSAAKEGELLVSDTTFRRLRERPAPMEALPPVMVKGKREALSLHRIDWARSRR
jgi:adenylate cyclase